MKKNDTNRDRDRWQILYIPDKPPIPPNQQQPTVNVFASIIDPKLANTLIRRLNQIAPLENLRHVKRIRKKQLEGVTWRPCNMMFESLSIPTSLQISCIIKRRVGRTMQALANIISSTNLYSNIDGITGFNEEDSQSVFSFMRFAVELAKSGDGLVTNAAVIVDPSVKKVIASACDEICSWNIPTNNQTSSFKVPDTCISRSNSNRIITHDTLPSNGSTSELKQLCTGASCLYPWRWSEQELYMPNSSCWHPLRHAAIVAIECSAARDRQLFPDLGDNEDKSFELDHMHSSTSSPAKRQKVNLENVEDTEKLDTLTEGCHPVAARPYLCTGYDIYLVWEPCTMCAMALVHQRIRRIFYAFPNPNAGALGSVHRLQGEKSLNHHYAVFRVLLPEEVLSVEL
ncbi:tRNA-specific adenosine deaminase TAD3 isoform X3 [Quercus lobata]|uniref:tRNA-specific adenosine deaminase TAD3 isoform X3 n=1 Tax=Quercus lobata TaxID=97700 RepID=UPI0012449EA8|nr:tRNA-specific adenosine deaminase TAD3 isoform X3 [Quercus lobata]